MNPTQGAVQWIETDATPLTDRSEAILVLRLGVAVNALRAQHRFTEAVRGVQQVGPARRREGLWAFLQALAFLKEALKIVKTADGRPTLESGIVRRLAEAGQASRAVLESMDKIERDRHVASPIIARARDKVAFHWDRDIFSQWIDDVGATSNPLIWVEGSTPEEAVYRAAADAIEHGVLTSELVISYGGGDRDAAFDQLVPGIGGAIECVMRYYDAAIAGFLVQHGATLRKRSEASTK
jgi:hypothetical protein